MKKLLALLLALVMVLSLVACGEEDDSPRKKRRPAADDETTEITEETEEVTEDVTEDIPVETEVATEEVTEQETYEVTEIEEVESVEGYVYGDYYENEYFWFGFEPDSDWKFASDAEIKQSGYAASMDDANAGAFICDMMAASTSSVSSGIAANVLFGIQEENFLTKNLTDMEYAEASAEGGVASLEAAGAKDIEHEIVEVEIAGQDCVALVLASTINGIDVYQVMIFIRDGNYAGLVTITAESLEHCAEIMEYFYSL